MNVSKSEFDNRWNNDMGFDHHEKTVRIVPELSHRYQYESPELMVRALYFKSFTKIWILDMEPGRQTRI